MCFKSKNIDHIISNCPSNITNVHTHFNNNTDTSTDSMNDDFISDHALLSCIYNDKDICIPPSAVQSST